MNENKSISSIGQVAQRLGQIPDRVRLIAHDLGITPNMTINGVPYYLESDVARMAEILDSVATNELQRRAGGLR